MDAEEKLVWLGIKRGGRKVSQVASDVEHLKQTVGDWDAFSDLVVNQTDAYSGLKTELVDTHGWSSAEADAFIARLKNEFNSYNDFQSSVDGWSTYQQLQSYFDTATTYTSDSLTADGAPAAGIRFHESDGISYDGVQVPAGTAEIFGVRVEVSRQDPPRGTKDSVTYANFQSDDADNVTDVGTPITFSADVTNPNNYGVTAQVPLTENGSVISTKEVRLEGNATTAVEFSVTKDDYVCADYAIGDADPILACWNPTGVAKSVQ